MKRKSEKTEQALLLAEQQVRMGNESVIAMTKALFVKDRDTGEHSHRVAFYASKLGEKYGFSEDEIRNLRKAAILHDIGKIAVPDAVLNKPAKLTDEEYEIIKSHAPVGADILKGFTMIRHVQAGARYHHERYDGKGYPDGLSGEDIPLYGRIISIADAYDAMTAKRVYRNALDMDQVIGELKRCRGTQFDPDLTDLFLQLIEEGAIDPATTIKEYSKRDLTEDIE
jgi:energy-coupling factor transport system substrate-specific component